VHCDALPVLKLPAGHAVPAVVRAVLATSGWVVLTARKPEKVIVQILAQEELLADRLKVFEFGLHT